jgi:CheY-like chemotaxis protein
VVNEPGSIIDIGFELTPKKLLMVVDDELAIQAIIFDTLEADYRIVNASNGREGVARAAKIRPDLILMDMMMPDIGGYEAVRLLNADRLTRNIPVIVITAQNFDDSTIQLIKREPNVVDFLRKPFKPQQLRQIVLKALEKGKGTA